MSADSFFRYGHALAKIVFIIQNEVTEIAEISLSGSLHFVTLEFLLKNITCICLMRKFQICLHQRH